MENKKILATRVGGSTAGLGIGLGLLTMLVLGSSWMLSSKGETEKQKAEQESTDLHPVMIRKPSGPPTVSIALPQASLAAEAVHPEVTTVRCSQCHTTRKPNFQNNSSAQLDEFHKGFSFSHGNLSCLSCHNSDDYDSLKLASGEKVEFKNVMKLCAQCHSQQMKDYTHGAHGGMNGYWDRKKGPQSKNNCIDCHNPHGPKFPKMEPTFKPKDRFLESSH